MNWSNQRWKLPNVLQIKCEVVTQKKLTHVTSTRDVGELKVGAECMTVCVYLLEFDEEISSNIEYRNLY